MMRSDREHGRDRKSLSSPSRFAGFWAWISSIMMDPRQILAGFLTFTMFAMLAHMIKREHIDKMMNSSNNAFEFDNSAERTVMSFGGSNGLWLEGSAELKPCWKKPTSETVQSDGYVTFSLTDGPEYHVSQISDAVVVARNLGATLVLPDIRGSRLGDKRSFGEVYNVKKFMESLEGVVKVVEEKPSEISSQNLAVVKVPNRVTENHIAVHIEPVFRSKGNIRVATYFPSINMKRTEGKSESDSVACLAMFGSLELQSDVKEVVDVMVERLRTLSRKTDGRFVAIDLRVDFLGRKGCQGGEGDLGTKSCYNALEVATFLKKLGFDEDTTVYLTQSRWDSSLNGLKEHFPKTYTKEGIMPAEKKEKFLDEEAPTIEEVIDFHICSESDVFVPAISGLFYGNVVGKRIASGKTEILVPTDSFSVFSAATPGDYISHYVTKRNHLAYSCFC